MTARPLEILENDDNNLQIYFVRPYMGMQNGSKLDIWQQGFLIHTFELEIWPSKIFPYVCTGNSYMCIYNDLHLYWDISQCWKPYLLKLLCREPACIVYMGIYARTLCRVMDWFPDYFFCLVCWFAWKNLSRKKKKIEKKLNNIIHGGAREHLEI